MLHDPVKTTGSGRPKILVQGSIGYFYQITLFWIISLYDYFFICHIFLALLSHILILNILILLTRKSLNIYLFLLPLLPFPPHFAIVCLSLLGYLSVSGLVNNTLSKDSEHKDIFTGKCFLHCTGKK